MTADASVPLPSGRAGLLREFIDELPVPALLRLDDGLHPNRAALRLIGAATPTPVGIERWFGLCFGDRAQTMRARYESDRAAGFPAPREMALRAADGGVREVEMVARRLAGGELWLLHDITERSITTRALADSEARFRDLADAGGEFIVEVDLEGRFTFVSEQVREVLGYPPERLLGRTPSDFMPPEEVPRVRAWVQANMTCDGRIRELEHRFVKPTGEVIWIRVSSNPILDASGRRIGQRGVGRDVTESRREAEAVASNEAQLRMLLECAQDGIFIADREGRCFYANPSGCAMLGYAARDLGGRPFAQLLAPAERPRLADKTALLAAGATVREEWWLQRSDGTSLPAEISHQRLPDGCYLAVVRDISERRRAEGAVREMNLSLERRVAERTEELERANRELEAFSYSVSHDLRAPLRAINGFSQILAETEHERLSEDGQLLLDRVVHNTNKMGKLIDDILAYSRAGRLPLARGTVDLAELAAGVVAELSEQFPAARLDLGPLPPVAGDAAMLRQVLVNLIHNACKFSSIRAQPQISVRGAIEGGHALLRVRDNGAGFDMRYADKLFGMFQRMHGETVFPGTGVGLAIVKRLVERHGGSVWAQASPDAGAEFFVSLPAGP